MKTKELMDRIDQTAQDPEVKKDADLEQGLLLAYKDLANGKDMKGVALKLDNSISMYLMTHEYKAPQAVIDLVKAMKNDANSFWKGTGISNLFW